jgi:eukaryotic-like serine/threonine-protein kinase
LDHPNIVSLIESGEHNGELFYTMSLVQGRSLAQLSAECARRDADWFRRTAKLLSTVAQAIHYAHQRGVLHRDLKPSNILVDDNSEPKITDFGLAKIRESDAGLTRTESLLGSPNYMAPEQAAGPAHLVTTAADVYSLGAILYELICGSPPFEAPTAIETMRRVVDNAPETPRRRNPAVDRDLESICLKCLEKEPQHRYASAADLGADLERWLAGRPIQARPMSRFERTWRWCRRNPALASLTALSVSCIVVLAIGAGVAIHRIQAANRESQTLLRRLQLDQVESYFAEGDSARGIALLAHLLRAQPDDLTVGVRLKSALELRPIARPFTQPWLSGSEILALGFNPAASQGVALSRQGELHVRNLETGSVSTLRLADDEPLAHGALSPDATRLATAHADGTVMLWNVARPHTPHARLEHPGPIRFLQFDRAGALLATGCEDGSVRIWEVGAGTLIRPVMQHPNICRAAAFSPDGRTLATGCDDGAVRMWSISGDDQARTLEPFPNAIWVIGFDAAGTQLAAGTVDGSVRIWQWSRPTAPLSISFSPPLSPTCSSVRTAV